MPLIRPATEADAAVIDALSRAGRAAVADQRGGRQLLAACRDGGEVLVAELDGHVFGLLRLHIDGPTATVAEVFVDPQARELGCGDGLLEAAMDTARERGCEWLEGIALPGDRATKNLYERAGVVARAIVVSTRL